MIQNFEFIIFLLSLIFIAVISIKIIIPTLIFMLTMVIMMLSYKGKMPLERIVEYNAEER